MLFEEILPITPITHQKRKCCNKINKPRHLPNNKKRHLKNGEAVALSQFPKIILINLDSFERITWKCLFISTKTLDFQSVVDKFLNLYFLSAEGGNNINGSKSWIKINSMHTYFLKGCYRILAHFTTSLTNTAADQNSNADGGRK